MRYPNEDANHWCCSPATAESTYLPYNSLMRVSHPDHSCMHLVPTSTHPPDFRSRSAPRRLQAVCHPPAADVQGHKWGSSLVIRCTCYTSGVPSQHSLRSCPHAMSALGWSGGPTSCHRGINVVHQSGAPASRVCVGRCERGARARYMRRAGLSQDCTEAAVSRYCVMGHHGRRYPAASIAS
jgi:hypothetical protein